MERGVTQREDPAFADAQHVDAVQSMLATDEFYAIVQVAIDVVVDRQPSIPATGISPIDGVQIDALEEQVAD